MRSTAESLPSDAIRVFIGNLVPSISDVAVIRLFSRFGDVLDLERNTRDDFAHLSIKPKANDSSEIERCISSLNRTSWCGTTLRVERAHEHFLARLKREWAEERNRDSDGATEVATDTSCGEHFTNFKKGKHTKFSFPDFEPPKFAMKSQKEEDPKEISSAPTSCSLANQSESELNLDRQEAPANPSSAKSAKLDSTLALFGLCSTAVDKPDVAEGVSKHKRCEPTHEQGPTKRLRTAIGTEEQIKEVNKPSSLIDVISEKQAARMVLQKLFPESHANPSGSISYRRLGLYRKLLLDSDKMSNRAEEEARKQDESRAPVPEPLRLSESAGASSPVSFRRAGLYKMLETETSS